jgi:hypothetical protein
MAVGKRGRERKKEERWSRRIERETVTLVPWPSAGLLVATDRAAAR